MRFLVVAAVAACMSGVAFAASLKTAPTADTVKIWESARCWVCGTGGGTTNGTKPI